MADSHGFKKDDQVMGDLNQLDFVMGNAGLIKGPILEIGSKDYGNTNDFRSLLKGKVYVGVDREPGKGVDIALDFTYEYESLIPQVGFEKFGTIICMSVLEHCHNPFKLAENISNFLADDGIVFLSIPFVWNIHAFPNDYWRFTPASVPVLFPDCTVVQDKSFYSTKIRGETFALDTPLAFNDMFNSGLANKLVRGFRRFGFMKNKYPYVLYPVMVNTLLTKQAVSR